MDWLHALTVVAGLCALALFLKNRRTAPQVPHVEGQPAIVCSVMDINPGKPHQSWLQLCKKHGSLGVFGIQVFQQPKAVVTRPKDIKYVLGTAFKRTARPAYMKNLQPFFGPKSFFLTDGDDWRSRRTSFKQCFAPAHEQRWLDIIQSRVDRLLPLLSDAVTCDDPVDMKVQFSRLWLDVNGLISFDFDFDSQSGSGKYDKCFDNIWNHMTRRIFHRFPYWKFFPNRPDVKAFNDSIDLFEGAVKQIVAKKKACSNVAGADALSMMLREHDFDENELRDQVFTFLNGGTDTASSMSTWLLYLISTHAEVEKKLLAELDKHVGIGGKFTLDHLKSLDYCHSVVKEALRVLPPSTQISRLVTEDIKLDDCVIPKGWEVVVPIFAIHHLPSLWEKPEMFWPERWEAPHVDKIESGAWVPFLSGPRNCIGHRLAIVEGVTILATLYSRFKFRLAPNQDIVQDSGGILRVKGALSMFPIPRT